MILDIRQVLALHRFLVKEFGGMEGVRDMGLLEAAIHRPYAVFGGQELYPTPTEKAASIFESVVRNHPFLDGNKRIGYTLMRLVLMNFGYDISANESDKYVFVIKTAAGELEFEEIKKWIGEKLIKTP